MSPVTKNFLSIRLIYCINYLFLENLFSLVQTTVVRGFFRGKCC